MRILAVLLLLLAVPLAGGTFQPTQDIDFWRDTKVDLPYARTFISNEICKSDVNLFASCVRAFKQAAFILKSKAFNPILISKFESNKNVEFDKALEVVDSLATADAEVSRELVFGAMINAQLREFDTHAALIPVDKLNARSGGSEESLTGIGIDDEVNARGVYIRRVYPNTPAESVGLLPNDRIVSLNGKTVRGGIRARGSLKELTKSPGHTVEMVVERAGKKFSTAVSVANLSLRNVTVTFSQFGKDTYALATIRAFAVGTANDLARQLAFTEGKIKGLILDLRGNPGGLTQEAAAVFGLFSGDKKLVERRAIPPALPKQFPLKTQFSAEDMKATNGIGPAVYPDLPLYILVNSTSASASEMLSAALQDHGRAWVIGEVTSGKGSTQTDVDEPNRAKLRLIYTVSRYYRPQGAPLQLIGVTPNFIVPIEMNATAEERTFLREGEIFGRLLERETYPAWKETRETQVSGLKSCLKQSNLVERMRSWFIEQNEYEDYQMSYALAVARCAQDKVD